MIIDSLIVDQRSRTLKRTVYRKERHYLIFIGALFWPASAVRCSDETKLPDPWSRVSDVIETVKAEEDGPRLPSTGICSLKYLM